MTNQLIYRKTVTETLTFVDTPGEAVRQQLAAQGYRYDGKSRQWFRSVSDSAVRDETAVVAA